MTRNDYIRILSLTCLLYACQRPAIEPNRKAPLEQRSEITRPTSKAPPTSFPQVINNPILTSQPGAIGMWSAPPSLAPSTTALRNNHFAVDITGIDTLSDGVTPRSRTGVLLSKDYMITCRHNHRKRRMRKTVPQSQWWTHPDGHSYLFKSPGSPVANIRAVDAENIADLDISVLKIEWSDQNQAQMQPYPPIAHQNELTIKSPVHWVGFPRQHSVNGTIKKYDGSPVKRSGSVVDIQSNNDIGVDVQAALGDSGSGIIDNEGRLTSVLCYGLPPITYGIPVWKILQRSKLLKPRIP